MTFQFADMHCGAVSTTGKIIKLKQSAGVKPISAYIYRPSKPNAKLVPLVAVHGISREAEKQAQLFSNMAEATGRIVIAPSFGRKHWSGYQRITNTHRADLALLSLLRWLDERGIAVTRRFDLFGYSGGAQFAHRFAMLYPQKIDHLYLAAAGWYCMPSVTAEYPYGLAPQTNRRVDWGTRMRASLDAYLRLPVSVSIGAKDRFSDAAVRRTPALDKAQGTNRFERAARYCAAFERAAHEHSIVPDITLTTLPNCLHSFDQCVEVGGLDRLVFDTPTYPSTQITKGIAL